MADAYLANYNLQKILDAEFTTESYKKKTGMNLQYRLKSYAHRPRVSRGGRAGTARGLPVRPPREERTKHETKPRRNLQYRSEIREHR